MSARRSALALERPAGLADVPDSVASAWDASLRYVADSSPGITRRRSGRGFRYLDDRGALVRDPAALARIRSLAIPPAWTSVWICPRPDGHLQATGRDVRGRKQYRYHPHFRERREQAKFDRLILFGETLPALRARVEKDLALAGFPKEKALALVVRLLDVNAYLRETTGQEFTAKDFRTWSGTVLAALALRELRSLGTQSPTKKALMEAIGEVAGRLGNTPVICRKCYVHPVVLDAYMEGSTIGPVRVWTSRLAPEAALSLRPEETAVLHFLRRRLARSERRRAERA